jgi:oxalate decarboxylase/phosphoglucose isomerase-like protein (cupin superfamily)
MALGTQQLPIGAGIRVHQHNEADEVLFVLEGRRAVASSTRSASPSKKGSAMFVPKGAWHGVENPEVEMTLLWVAAPPGLEDFFREVGHAGGRAAAQHHARTVRRHRAQARDAFPLGAPPCRGYWKALIR